MSHENNIVASDEVETNKSALEVVIVWGESTNVLHVSHLSPPRSYCVGESLGNDPDSGYLMGSDVLGVERLPVVSETSNGLAVVFPQGSTGEVVLAHGTRSLSDLHREGLLRPSTELAGAMEYPLTVDATVYVHYRGFTFIVRPVQAGKAVGAGLKIDRRPYYFVGASLLVHAAVLFAFYFLPPHASALSIDNMASDPRLVSYMMEPPETHEEIIVASQAPGDGAESLEGTPHKDEAGEMGNPEERRTRKRYGVVGPENNPNPQLPRERAREESRTAGILGVLRQTGSWSSPTSPYGADNAIGRDALSALGALMGEQIGDNFGRNGLGPRGPGRGGGGDAEGTVGVGDLRTIGTDGNGRRDNGYGRDGGRFAQRGSRVPILRPESAEVRGSLTKEAIQRTVRRHLNEVRFCYEQELDSHPDLAGRVAIAFIVSPSGSVQSSQATTSTINNGRVESCIATAVRRLTFPQPEGGGVVIVNYPFFMQPSGG